MTHTYTLSSTQPPTYIIEIPNAHRQKTREACKGESPGRRVWGVLGRVRRKRKRRKQGELTKDQRNVMGMEERRRRRYLRRRRKLGRGEVWRKMHPSLTQEQVFEIAPPPSPRGE